MYIRCRVSSDFSCKMKIRTVVKTQSEIPAWQPAEKPETILSRVKQLTQDLHAIQHELYAELSEEDGSPRKDSILALSRAAVDLSAFKAAADQLRRVLWYYLEDATQSCGGDARERHNMIEVREPRTSAAEPLAQPLEAGSFFERLNLVIDGYMRERGIPGSGTSKS